MAQVGPQGVPTPAAAPVQAVDVSISSDDRKALIDYFKQFVYATKQPFYVYNWFDSSKMSDAWKDKRSASDARGYDYVAKKSKVHWDNQDLPGAHPRENQWGAGLYVATDPVASAGFGQESWELVQMRLPAGFRILDSDKDAYHYYPPQIFAIFQKYGCESHAIVDLLKTEDTSPPCLSIIKKIFGEDLQVQAFNYGFPASKFNDCAPTATHQTAFVITNSKQLKPDDIKIFNSATSDDREDRIRIQSLFYKVAYDDNQPGTPVPSYPGYLYFRSSIACDNSTCQKIMTICARGNYSDCKTIPYSTLSVPMKMSMETAPPRAGHKEGLLWSDLNGKAIPSDMDSWTQKNLYGCGASAPYGPAPDLQAKDDPSCGPEANKILKLLNGN